jgi:hypothetical protein
LADGLEADAVDGYLAETDRPSTLVEPKPRATGLTFDEIIADHPDYLHPEAFLVVSTTFEVTAYRTLWFGLPYGLGDGRTGQDGRERRARDCTLVDGEPSGDGHLQGQFAALKDVVGDMLEKGGFTPSTARQYLKRKLAMESGTDRSCASRPVSLPSRRRV